MREVCNILNLGVAERTWVVAHVFRMVMLATVLLIATSAVCHAADVDTGDVYFHQGSTNFIGGKMEAAKEKVEEGLELYPQNAKLTALKKLLEQQKKDDKQKQQDKQKQKEKQDKQKEKENKQKQKEKQDKKNDKQQEQKEPPKKNEMTKDEAEMLLDAMKQKEQADRDKLRIILGRPQRVDKNW